MRPMKDVTFPAKPVSRPKKPRSAYNFFFSEERLRVHARILEETGSRPRNAEVSGLVAARWKNLDQSEKQRYLALAAKDKHDYALRMIQEYTLKREDLCNKSSAAAHRNQSPKGIARNWTQVTKNIDPSTTLGNSTDAVLLPSSFAMSPAPVAGTLRDVTPPKAVFASTKMQGGTNISKFAELQASRDHFLDFHQDKGCVPGPSLEPFHLSIQEHEFSFDEDAVELLEQTFHVRHHLH